VLAQFSAGNAILAAALKRIKVLDSGKNGSELYDLTGKIIANPVDNSFSHLATERRGRRDFDGKAVRGKDSLQQHDIRSAALARTGNCAQGLEHRAIRS
jgi:hypothetical protein